MSSEPPHLSASNPVGSYSTGSQKAKVSRYQPSLLFALLPAFVEMMMIIRAVPNPRHDEYNCMLHSLAPRMMSTNDVRARHILQCISGCERDSNSR